MLYCRNIHYIIDTIHWLHILEANIDRTSKFLVLKFFVGNINLSTLVEHYRIGCIFVQFEMSSNGNLDIELYSLNLPQLSKLCKSLHHNLFKIIELIYPFREVILKKLLDMLI